MWQLLRVPAAAERGGSRSSKRPTPRESPAWTSAVLLRGWRGGSAAKTPAAYRRSGSGFKHPHGGSQPSITPVLREPAPSTDVQGYQACTQYTVIHSGKTLIHINKF